MIVVEKEGLRGESKGAEAEDHHEGEYSEGGEEAQADCPRIPGEVPVFQLGVVGNPVVVGRKRHTSHVHEGDRAGAKAEKFLKRRVRRGLGTVYRINQRMEMPTGAVAPVALSLDHEGSGIEDPKYTHDGGVLQG